MRRSYKGANRCEGRSVLNAMDLNRRPSRMCFVTCIFGSLLLIILFCAWTFNAATNLHTEVRYFRSEYAQYNHNGAQVHMWNHLNIRGNLPQTAPNDKELAIIQEQPPSDTGAGGRCQVDKFYCGCKLFSTDPIPDDNEVIDAFAYDFGLSPNARRIDVAKETSFHADEERDKAGINGSIQVSKVPKRFHFISRLLESSKPGTDWCGDIPCSYVKYINKYRQMHKEGGWQFLLHCKDQVESLIKLRNPELWDAYKNYPQDIQRSDLARYVVLYNYGGVYSDMDVEILKSVDYLLNKFPRVNVFLGVESNLANPTLQRQMRELKEKCNSAEVNADLRDLCDKCQASIGAERFGPFMGCVHSIREGRPEKELRIANYWMLTSPRHPFWEDVIELAKRRAGLPVNSQYDILYTSGPDVVTEIFHLYKKNRKLKDLKALSNTTMENFNIHWTNKQHEWRKKLSDKVCKIGGMC